MNETKSILPPEFVSTLMTVTGKRGIGKTMLASQADFPQNITMHDFEEKGESIAEQLQFNSYFPLVRMAKGDPIELFNQFDYHARHIPNGTTVLILDNISPLEVAFKAHIVDNAKHYAKRYGLNAGNIVSGRFGGASAAANFMISEYCAAIYEQGVRLIIQIAHIGNFWSAGGIVPNKSTIKGLDRWQQLSSLSLVLVPGRQGEKPAVPAALVMKEQLGKISIDDIPDDQLESYIRGEMGHEIIRRLPQRIPECTFQKIRWYLYNPANVENPAEGEIPTAEEIQPFQTKLSKEQFEIVHALAIKESIAQEEEDELVAAMEEQETSELIDRVRPLVEAGKSIPEIAAKLGEDIPTIAMITTKL